MPRTSLSSYGGPAAVLGGALYIGSFGMVYLIHGPFAGQAEETFLGTRAFVYGLHAPMYVLLLLGAVGVYARQRGDFGRTGRVGFYLTALGFALGAIGSAAVLALLLTGGGAALGAALVVAHALSHVLYATGSVLLGLATFRAGLLPKAAAVMVGLGPAWLLVLFLVGNPQSPLLLSPPFLITALGWMWLGFALLRRAGVPGHPGALSPARPGARPVRR